MAGEFDVCNAAFSMAARTVIYGICACTDGTLKFNLKCNDLSEIIV